MNQVCKSVEYFNDIYQHICDVDVGKFKKLYKDAKEADCIIRVAEGRSKAAMDTGINQIQKEVKTITDPDFPGRSLKEAAPILEKKYEKIVLLINSGSGETTTPKETANELKEYIEETNSKRFTIDAITSDIKSTIGEIAQKYGNVLELKGREKEPFTTEEFSRFGIMGDIFELESCLLIQMIKEGVNEDQDYQRVMEKAKEEMAEIGKTIDEHIDSDLYTSLVRDMTPRNQIVVGGIGPAENVALMTAIRLNHIKSPIGDGAWVVGPFAPRPRLNDLLLLISWSGKTAPVLQWCDDFQRAGALVYSVVGRDSSLSKKSRYFNLDISPGRFYLKAAFLLSPLAVKLVASLEKQGYVLPEHILRWAHSLTE